MCGLLLVQWFKFLELAHSLSTHDVCTNCKASAVGRIDIYEVLRRWKATSHSALNLRCSLKTNPFIAVFCKRWRSYTPTESSPISPGSPFSK
ncbi:hypothetical protein GALMADRAFT_1264606 [Galerina marginata CBS 339.88]|uniref:Secreted protein n=1 Tax=Galerina marginata (strain CBS 339.88) TaxID=685588 RepID=A0A067T693_GALM3|nr:hypothetical protein GALMADRAFT_1264606 [Galerina marginata CBS 339.88]